MNIKIKRLHPDAKMPKRGTKYAAGFDLYAAEEFDAPIFEEQTVRIQTGLAFEIPEGYVGVVYSRSSTALKGLIITPLLVDADYRGPVYITLNNLTTEVGGFRYSRGFSPRGCPRFAVTPTTKSLLTQPLYGKGRNPPPSEPPELALGDPFSGLNDYDTGVKPGCYSG